MFLLSCISYLIVKGFFHYAMTMKRWDKEGKDYTVADIDRWHRQRGFKMVGYHYVTYLDRTIEQGRPIEMIGTHRSGHNAHSIGICYIEGLRLRPSETSGIYVPAGTRTPQQRASMLSLIEQLREEFPGVTLHGHREFAPKACLCFKIPLEL